MLGGGGGMPLRETDIKAIATPAGTTKMILVLRLGNDESHFNVSLIVRDKVTNKTVSTGLRLESPSALLSLQTLWNCDTMMIS